MSAVLTDRPPVPSHLDPAVALAFRTPLQEHVASADGKSAGVLTLLGLMFTVTARLGATLGDTLEGSGPIKWLALALLIGFAGLAVATVVQMFRTISPRFPGAEPSLAFFGDIARMDREEYLRRVKSLTSEDALLQILRYNHTTSTIVQNKFRQLQLGLRLFRYTVCAWLPLVVYLIIKAL